MDALNYAAWVLKPTSNDGTEEPSVQPNAPQPTMTTAMSVDGGDDGGGDDASKTTSPTNDNIVATTPTDGGVVINDGVDNITRTKTTTSPNKPSAVDEHLQKTGDRAAILFIVGDEDDDDVDYNNNGVKDGTKKLDKADEPMATAEEEEDEDDQPLRKEAETINIPLNDYLCALNACSLKELQLLLYNVQARKHMIAYLQQHCRLRTMHLKPAERNQWLQCHDLSTQSVNHTYACNGYLELTVRQYFFAKHGLKLKHPYLPCMIEFGGGSHASYYPLEVINVVVEHTPMLSSFTGQQQQHQQQHCASSELEPLKQRTRRSPLHSMFGGVFEVPPQFPTIYKSKNNTDKSSSSTAAVENQDQQQKSSNALMSDAHQGMMVLPPPPPPPPPPSKQQQGRAHCCRCCCCECSESACRDANPSTR